MTIANSRKTDNKNNPLSITKIVVVCLAEATRAFLFLVCQPEVEKVRGYSAGSERCSSKTREVGKRRLRTSLSSTALPCLVKMAERFVEIREEEQGKGKEENARWGFRMCSATTSERIAHFQCDRGRECKFVERATSHEPPNDLRNVLPGDFQHRRFFDFATSNHWLWRISTRDVEVLTRVSLRCDQQKRQVSAASSHELHFR